MIIQWFPGHMAKAKRRMEESLKKVDSLVYVLDARAPFSCINPEFDNLIQNKPVLYVINKCDMVEAADARAWEQYFKSKGQTVIATSGTVSRDAQKILALLNEINKEKIERNAIKGVRYAVKAMVIGMPNTGKSTLINALCRGKKTVTGDKPGVTKGEQWVRLPGGISLLDTPGTLSHSMKSEAVGLNLAFIGSVRDAVVDTAELSLALIAFFCRKFPKNLENRYGISASGTPLEILSAIAQKRGFVMKGAEPDLDKTALAVIDDFRKQRLGKITLEKPDEI